MSYKRIIENRKHKHSFSLSNIGEDDVKSLAEALKGTEITELVLIYNNFGFNGLKYLTQALRDTKIKRLNLENNNITDEGVIYLAESLHDTHIEHLDLSNNNFGFNGLKYLTRALRDTQITSFHLRNNNIMDDGVKYLAKSLQDTHMKKLDLCGNKIGIDAAYYLNTMVCNTKMQYLYLDIYFSEDGDPSKYISQRSHYQTNIDITLNNNKLGIKGAQYLNKTIQKIGIANLKLHGRDLEADDAQYLSDAFKDIKINKLIMSSSHITQHNGVQYLVQSFKGSQIARLVVNGAFTSAAGARCIADFLREVKVLDFGLEYDGVDGDEAMKYLAPVLENSDIMYINLESNNIKAEGARYLSKILRNSKIVKLYLYDNGIGNDGARYLAEGLPNSQVTDIHLDSNGIEYAGYRCFIDVVESTNLSSVIFYDNNIDAGLVDEGTPLWLRTLPFILKRNTTSIAQKICHVFKELVSLNPISNEFEFVAPKKDTFSPVDIDDYAFLIRTLNDNPNCKVHIFHEMCRKEWVYDLNVMNKINEFIAKIQNKFSKFFDVKLPDFVESFVDFDYVNLVKKFDDMKLCEIVQYLLLHRVLYYVDENQEILHPYIYKMLHKYSMPLYNEELEPNKKGEIIAYYRSHLEIDGAQEITDFLASESL